MNDQQFSIVDAPGPDSYPVAGYTWTIIRSHLADAARRRAVAALFSWVVTTGQRYTAKLRYVPLPPAVQAVAQRALGRIAP